MESEEHYKKEITRNQKLRDIAALRELVRDRAKLVVGDYHQDPKIEIRVEAQKGMRVGDQNYIPIAHSVSEFLRECLADLYLRWLEEKSIKLSNAEPPHLWRCDLCERKVSKDSLKPVPSGQASLVSNLCWKCREVRGWTEEKREAAMKKLRALLAGEQTGETP
jgi:hypothetical protein